MYIYIYIYLKKICIYMYLYIYICIHMFTYFRPPNGSCFTSLEVRFHVRLRECMACL